MKIDMPKTKETQKIEETEVKTAKIVPAVKKVHPVVKAAEAEAIDAVVPEAVMEGDIDGDGAETAGGKKKADRYYEAVGRRKTAIARVRLYTRGDKVFLVNDGPFGKYFVGDAYKNIIEAPLVKMNCTDRFRITARVMGGGVNAQAEALRHGITRALVMFNADFKKRLKKSGYLTRDPRMKERKKPGLKKARRAPQWAKR
jgi:small subunit ribosomal protein S9